MYIKELMSIYEASGLEGSLGLMEPSATLAVMFDDDSVYTAEDYETPAEIEDRIERSKKAGKNLFKEEWELWEPKPGCIY